jgi:perosamine synthetase
MGLVKPLPYGRQSIDDTDVEAVVAALRGDWLTQGPTVGKFEDALRELTGARYCVAVANGTAALHLAALAAGVKPGDTGVTSTITFVASANCMRYAGGAPSFADVDPTTSLVDVASLEAKVSELTRAGRAPKLLVPVDMTGAVADLPRVHAIAKRCGAVVVEDAAHSLGATYAHDGKTFRAASCTHADLAILSFHPVKHLTTAEGGAITTNDEGLYKELLDLRTHGITRDPQHLERNDGPWYYEQRTLGFNYRITDLQCALGITQAKKFPDFLARRRAIAARYDAAFAEASLARHVMPLVVPTGVTSAYHLYVVRLRARDGESVTSVAERRKRLFLELRERQIFPQVHYIPVHSQPDFRRAGLGDGAFPGADAYYASCISLPMFPSMTDADVDRVVSTVGELVEASAREAR